MGEINGTSNIKSVKRHEKQHVSMFLYKGAFEQLNNSMDAHDE